jgi:hypothetical protein
VAEWDAQDLKDQLEELKSHHTTTWANLQDPALTLKEEKDKK